MNVDVFPENLAPGDAFVYASDVPDINGTYLLLARCTDEDERPVFKAFIVDDSGRCEIMRFVFDRFYHPKDVRVT